MKDELLSLRRPDISRLAAIGAIICSLAILSACSMSPGMYMGKPQDVAKALNEEGAPPGALMTISPQLIDQLRTERHSEVTQDIKRLFGSEEHTSELQSREN